MNFQASVDYLYSLGNEVTAMKLGLENIRRLIAALGDPQNNYLKVQVAGTNGKGSVCAFLGSICNAAKIETGLYTSPHLISITERIRIAGREISESDFARIATDVRYKAETLVRQGELEAMPTFFEHVTAIALLAFSESNVEIAILETGLGGRLDATTAANAEIAAITQIDYDHQIYLGETIGEIAAEKAAIIRTGMDAVIARQSKDAEKIVMGRCREVGTEAVWATTDIVTKRHGDELLHPFYSSTFKTKRQAYRNIIPGLEGKHQIANAAVAIGLAELLQNRGFSISSEQIVKGIETAKHPGRLEYWGNFLFDGAHNVAGAKALRLYLDEFVNGPITLLFGTMRDKNVCEIAGLLFPKANRVILTRPDNLRALSAEELLGFIPNDIESNTVICAGSVVEALKIVGRFPDHVTCVTGSLYLIGEVQKLLTAADK